MKKAGILFSLLFGAFMSFGQDEEEASVSLIADIMAVNPVEMVMDESTKEADQEYIASLEEQKSKVEELLGKHGDKFKEDVAEEIERFNKVLSKTIQKDVETEKRRVATSVNALSMGLLKSKKMVMMEFNNKMTQEIRKLPRALVMDKEKELKDIIDDYKKKFEEELKMNQEVIKSFKATEHLVKTEETAEEDQ